MFGFYLNDKILDFMLMARDMEVLKEGVECKWHFGRDVNHCSQRADSGGLYFLKMAATIYPIPHAHFTS